jgi:hypothetical protein
MKPYGPSKLRGYVKAPEGLDAQRYRELRNHAAREIADYTAMFVLQDGRVGSGTFVNTNGVDGILTAHHVARKLIKPGGIFHLVIASRAHKLPVSADLFEHVVIGDSTSHEHPQMGPDLSFLKILDVRLVGAIKARKSFLHLDGKHFSFFRTHPKRGMTWFVAGNPYEFAQPLGIQGSPPEPLTKLTNFVGDALYCSISERDGFDYIKVKVPSGQHAFPTQYGGVSGGGIWMVPLSIGGDEALDSIRYEAPFLAGVVFYESSARKNERVITGHGPNSIYARCIQIAKPPSRALEGMNVHVDARRKRLVAACPVLAA